MGLDELRRESSEVAADGRGAIERYVEQVCRRARAFLDGPRSRPLHDRISLWRTGAYIVGASVEEGAPAPAEFTPSSAFVTCCGLDELDERLRATLCDYLVAETDRRVAAALHDILPGEDIHLLVTVGRRHGRPAARILAKAIVPYLVEFEYGLAASVGADVQRALKEAE